MEKIIYKHFKILVDNSYSNCVLYTHFGDRLFLTYSKDLNNNNWVDSIGFNRIMKIIFGEIKELDYILNKYHNDNWNKLTKGYFKFLDKNYDVILTIFDWKIIEKNTNNIIDDVLYSKLETDIRLKLLDMWMENKKIEKTEKETGIC